MGHHREGVKSSGDQFMLTGGRGHCVGLSGQEEGAGGEACSGGGAPAMRAEMRAGRASGTHMSSCMYAAAGVSVSTPPAARAGGSYLSAQQRNTADWGLISAGAPSARRLHSGLGNLHRGHRSLKRSTYKHIPHRDKPPHMVARRNARERRRVQAVNNAFVRLRRHIPYENKNKRLSKVKTLRIAIDYIHHMQDLIAEYDSKHQSAPVNTYCAGAPAPGLHSRAQSNRRAPAEAAKENHAWCSLHMNYSGELQAGTLPGPDECHPGPPPAQHGPHPQYPGPGAW